MSPLIVDRIWQGLLDTLTIMPTSALIAVLAGISLTPILVLTAPSNALGSSRVHRMLGVLVNGLRATPFIILLVTLLPLVWLAVGTTIDVWAAAMPLSISATPFFACIAGISLREVDRSLMEAAQAVDCERHHIVWHVLLSEALPDIAGGFALTVVSLIDVSAMVSAVGASRPGDITIHYGYQHFDTTAMAVVIVMLIRLVSLMQWVGDVPVRRLKVR